MLFIISELTVLGNRQHELFSVVVKLLCKFVGGKREFVLFLGALLTLVLCIDGF